MEDFYYIREYQDLMILTHEDESILCFGVELFENYGDKLLVPRGMMPHTPNHVFELGIIFTDRQGREYFNEGHVVLRGGEPTQIPFSSDIYDIEGLSSFESACHFKVLDESKL